MNRLQIESWRDHNGGFISEHRGRALKFSFPVLMAMLILVSSVAWFLKWPVTVEVTGEIRRPVEQNGEIIVELDSFPGALAGLPSGCPVNIQSTLFTANNNGEVAGKVRYVIREYEGENTKVAVTIVLSRRFNTTEMRDMLYGKGQKADLRITVGEMRLYQRLFNNNKM